MKHRLGTHLPETIVSSDNDKADADNNCIEDYWLRICELNREMKGEPIMIHMENRSVAYQSCQNCRRKWRKIVL